MLFFYELFVKVLSTCGADRMSNAELDEECNRKKFHGVDKVKMIFKDNIKR